MGQLLDPWQKQLVCGRSARDLAPFWLIRSPFLLPTPLLMKHWLLFGMCWLGLQLPLSAQWSQGQWQWLLQSGLSWPLAQAPTWRPLLGMSLQLSTQWEPTTWLALRTGVQYRLPQYLIQPTQEPVDHWVYAHRLALPLSLLLQMPGQQRWQGYAGLGVLSTLPLLVHAEVSSRNGDQLARGQADMQLDGPPWQPQVLLGVRHRMRDSHLFAFLEMVWHPNRPRQRWTYTGLEGHPAQATWEEQVLSLQLGFSF